jgi:hypothetical protein
MSVAERGEPDGSFQEIVGWGTRTSGGGNETGAQTRVSLPNWLSRLILNHITQRTFLKPAVP